MEAADKAVGSCTLQYTPLAHKHSAVSPHYIALTSITRVCYILTATTATVAACCMHVVAAPVSAPIAIVVQQHALQMHLMPSSLYSATVFYPW